MARGTITQTLEMYLLVLASLVAAEERLDVPHPSLAIDTLVNASFGSCNDEKKNLSMWSVIHSRQYQLWVFMGDNQKTLTRTLINLRLREFNSKKAM